jgi:DNA (cytosine-5)-methyltransferase 1
MAASTLRSLYPRRHTKKTPICIDLFCGAGGFSLGFCQAGGLPVAAVDSDEASVRTYRRMFPMCQEVHCGDIESWYPSAYLGDVDVMIGGPPLPRVLSRSWS